MERLIDGDTNASTETSIGERMVMTSCTTFTTFFAPSCALSRLSFKIGERRQRQFSSRVTGLLGHIAGPRRSDLFQLTVKVWDCRTASVPVIGLDGTDKSRRCKSDSHLARRVVVI